MLKRLASLSSARREPLISSVLPFDHSRVSRGYPVGRVLLSQTRGPLDFHRATIVFRSLLDAGTRSSMEPFSRARHPAGSAATVTLDLLDWRGRLLEMDAS
jgi:hypothetical protein